MDLKIWKSLIEYTAKLLNAMSMELFEDIFLYNFYGE